MDGIHLIRPASPSTFPSEGKAVPHTIGFAVHPSLLLEEKVPNEVRRMRWSNRNGRNPPHPAGFAVHLPLQGEGSTSPGPSPRGEGAERSEADEAAYRIAESGQKLF